MKIRTSVQDDVALIAVVGELNVDSLGKLEEAIAEGFDIYMRDFIIDVTGVTSVDSPALEVLTALHRRCEENLGMLRLCGASASLRKVLEVTRLDRVLVVTHNTDEAMASLQAATASVGGSATEAFEGAE
jgi:stage II sporulation protein AA (anti-sigma F factor antagonist)